MREESVFINKIIQYTKENDLKGWINQATDEELSFFYDKVFRQKNKFSRRILRDGKGVDASERLIAEVANLPYQTIKKSSKVISELLFKYLTQNENSESEIALQNIFWLVSYVKTGCDYILIKQFLMNHDLSTKNEIFILKILINIDPLRALDIINTIFIDNQSLEYVFLKMDILEDIDSKLCLTIFFNLHYPRVVSDKEKAMFYLRIRRALRNTIKEKNKIDFIKHHIKKLSNGWKQDLLKLIIEENKELKTVFDILIREDNIEKPLLEALRSDFVLYNTDEAINKLIDHPIYNWKIVSSVLIENIISREISLTREKMQLASELLVNFYLIYEYEFNSYIKKEFDLEVDLVGPFLKSENQNNILLIISKEFTKKHYNAKPLSLSAMFSAIEEREEREEREEIEIFI